MQLTQKEGRTARESGKNSLVLDVFLIGVLVAWSVSMGWLILQALRLLGIIRV